MALQQTETSMNSTLASNKYYQTASIVQIRLDVQQIIENIEMFLKGTQIIVSQDETTKRIITQSVPIGEAKANDLGIQAILNWVSSTLNPQVVQGNFPADGQHISTMYDNYIEEFNIDLVRFLLTNQIDWEISDRDVEYITDWIMKMIIPFMTRLIDNKERESFQESLRSFETTNTKESGNKNPLQMFP